jgi:hypothetical protein
MTAGSTALKKSCRLMLIGNNSCRSVPAAAPFALDPEERGSTMTIGTGKTPTADAVETSEFVEFATQGRTVAAKVGEKPGGGGPHKPGHNGGSWLPPLPTPPVVFY